MTILTQKSILATREWYADNARACIAEAVSGAVRVNGLPDYIKSCETRIVDATNGKYDSSFAFRQRAHNLQTGKCIGLLPKT